MIFADFFKALTQLTDARFQRVLWKAIGLTLVLLYASFVAASLALGWLLPDSWTLPFGWEISTAFVSIGAFVAMIALSFFLMFPVASVFVGIYLDDVAGAVEDLHYPNLPQIDKMPFLDTLADSLRFLALVVIANLLALIVYMFVPVFAPLVFWAVNGWLLGREYFQLTAARRIGIVAARDMASQHRGEIWFAGALMAVPMSIPLVNLIVPILGAATFTHMFHRLAAR